MAWLSTQKTAELIGVSDATMRDWRMQRIGPAYTKISPRCFRYDERDVQAFMAERRHDPSARASLERKHANHS